MGNSIYQQPNPPPTCIPLAVMHVLPRPSRDAVVYAADFLESTLIDLRNTRNYVNIEHQQGLQTVTDTAALLYVDSPGKRVSVDLFTGGGKTTAVANMLRYLMSFYGVPGHRGRGVVVCVGTTEQADELLQAIIGDPNTKETNDRHQCIGTYHSGDTATIRNKADVSRYPFVIVTHQRIKIQDWADFLEHDGRQRFVVWDEAMIASESRVIDILDLMEEIRDLETWLEAHEFFLDETIEAEHLETVRWLKTVKSRVKAVTEESTIRLPKKPDWAVQRMANGKQKIYERELEKRLNGFESRLILTLLNEHGRAVKVKPQSHAFWFVEQIPDTFRDILILDASTPIRKLVHLDDSIIRINAGVQKDYSAVTIHYCRARSSRYALEAKGQAEAYYKELQYIADTHVLAAHSLLTFALPQKGDGPDHLEALGKLARVNPVSWGRSKGINGLARECFGSHCGLVYRERKELAANAAGQKRDLDFSLTTSELEELQVSEIADQVYQAISRMQNRTTIALKALPTDFWLFFPDERILDLLKVVMPGVRVVDYVPRFVEPEGQNATTTAEAMRDWLTGSGLSKVSMQRIRKACGVEIKPDSKLWSDDIKPRFENMLNSIGWIKAGKSYVRNEAAGV